ncbi:MAG TPA: metallophosphoesterase [Bryobacteraceae bacterium]|nr:metallophosphoesterase [Bryobacteraceae bacterium]
MRLGWLTDIHLNFVSLAKREEFYLTLCHQHLDALLLGGDIGEADSVLQFLAEMEQALSVPIYFVLGNHDFYGASIAAVRESVSRETVRSSRLQWLSNQGVIPLTDTTALVGHDSWADGRLGDFFMSDVLLSDYFLIEELRCEDKQERYEKLNALGDEAAEFLESRTREALASHRHVIVLTHVPPFQDACWHEGQISSPDYLPHFACRAVGDRLLPIMQSHPDQILTVLCGHTHSPGVARILPNLVVHTGHAQYGEPTVQNILEL